MSRAFGRRNALAMHEMSYGPSMTPMVDVVMVILVFFMTSASVLGPEWLLRSLLPAPAASPAASAEEDAVRLVVWMRREGEVTGVRVNEEPTITVDALEGRLREAARRSEAGKIVVLVRPGDLVPYEEVVRVHEMCGRHGIRRVGLVGAGDGGR